MLTHSPSMLLNDSLSLAAFRPQLDAYALFQPRNLVLFVQLLGAKTMAADFNSIVARYCMRCACRWFVPFVYLPAHTFISFADKM